MPRNANPQNRLPEMRNSFLELTGFIYYLYISMKNTAATHKTSNSKGAAIFRKMLDDKMAIHEHIKKGGKISDLKDKFNFVKPVSIKGSC
jgi:hypothetical protein